MKKKTSFWGSGNRQISCIYSPGSCSDEGFYLCSGIFFISVVLLLFCVIDGMDSGIMNWRSINCLILFFCISPFFAKKFYDESRRFLCCSENGIFVLNEGQTPIDWILWKDISYAYKMRNYRGFVLNILSKRELAQREIRKMKYKDSYKIHNGDVIVLFHNRTDTADEFFKFLEDHLNYIEIK